MKNILVDSGFWIATYNKHDSNHNIAMDWLLNNNTENCRFITTWPVITEAFFIIKKYVSFAVALRFLSEHDKIYTLFDLNKDHTLRISKILDKYQDLKLDLADASLVLLAEQYNVADILTVDRNDFNTLRWGRNKTFNLLLDN